MAKARISTLTTDNRDVSCIIAAHNAVIQVLDSPTADVSARDRAAQYVELFETIYAGIRKAAATPTRGGVAGGSQS